VLVMRVGLTLANLIHRDRPELNGLQIPSLEVDIGDRALPDNRFVEQYIRRGRLKNEITQVVKDRPVAINLDSMQERRPMHHDDVRACIYFRMGPFF